MARRRKGEPEIPTALLQGQTDFAKRKITLLEAAEIDVMCERPFKQLELLRMLFPLDVVEHMFKANQYLERGYSNRVSYSGKALSNGQVANWWIDFNEVPCAPINDKTWAPHEDERLGEWVLKAHAIVAKWNNVRNVFDFLNVRGTVGHMRHYFPSVLALLPPGEQSTPIHQTDGKLFRERDGMGMWVEAIRTAAATVTGSLLLPTQAPRNNAMLTAALFVGDEKYSNTFKIV